MRFNLQSGHHEELHMEQFRLWKAVAASATDKIAFLGNRTSEGVKVFPASQHLPAGWNRQLPLSFIHIWAYSMIPLGHSSMRRVRPLLLKRLGQR